MNIIVELIHNGQDSHLTSKTRLMRKPVPKFRVSLSHCGVDWWWDSETMPTSLRCMCQTCGAFGLGKLQELDKPKSVKEGNRE